MSDSVWRSFLSSGDPASSEPPREVQLLRTAREELKAAKADAEAKQAQVDLMTAMLQAAEEELKLRSNQLDITNEMLKATEAELVRKDEQLEITTQMLRKAEEEISRSEHERMQLRKELRQSRGGAPLAPQPPPVPTAETLVLHDDDEPTSGGHGGHGGLSGQGGGGGSGGGRSYGGVMTSASAIMEARRRSTAEAAEAASKMAAGVEARLAKSFASMGDYDEQTRLSAAVPADLPEQRSRGRSGPATRVLLTHADAEAAMRPKKAVPDTREDVTTYIQSRSENEKLPPTHTSMRLEGGFDAETEDGSCLLYTSPSPRDS